MRKNKWRKEVRVTALENAIRECPLSFSCYHPWQSMFAIKDCSCSCLLMSAVARVCCHVSRIHVERRSFTPIIVIPMNQYLSLMSNLWIILGFTSEWGKGSHNFHVQDTVSKMSILSFFLGVHKEFILSILS